MREMKDSGVQWIGKIPKHWTVDNPKWHFVQRKDRAKKGLIQLTASQKYGVVTQEEYMEITGAKVVTVEKDFDILKLVCPGDFIIHMRSFQGGLEYSEKYGSISSAYVMLIPQKTILEPRFYKWFFKSPVYIDALSSTSNLIREGQAMRYANFIQLPILLLPKKEQEQIASILEKKCSEIDALLSDIQGQIEVLEEYKRSIITEAVTKGLDHDVEMKDSGVQWIGKIPKHWTVDNPKWHFVQRKDRAKKGLTQLTASQKYGVVTQEEYMEITGAKVVTVEKDFDILKLVCPGDFIIHMRSFQGGLEYSEKYGSISSAYVMLIPQKTILEPRFYKWFFKSPVYIDALSSTSNLIREGQAMRYANFIQLPIPLLPEEEQRKIADYLDRKCNEIESIISEKKQQIETIEEYKKSLIFEYVTGKKEVVKFE